MNIIITDKLSICITNSTLFIDTLVAIYSASRYPVY